MIDTEMGEILRKHFEFRKYPTNRFRVVGKQNPPYALKISVLKNFSNQTSDRIDFGLDNQEVFQFRSMWLTEFDGKITNYGCEVCCLTFGERESLAKLIERNPGYQVTFDIQTSSEEYFKRSREFLIKEFALRNNAPDRLKFLFWKTKVEVTVKAKIRILMIKKNR